MKNKLNFRTCSIELGENQARTAIAATEAAVPMPDFDRGMIVPEVLLMTGAKFNSSVPLLDCHQRQTIDNAKGKAINLRVEGNQLLCDLEISKSEESTRTKIDDKTITDLSVGYTVFKKTFVAKGQRKSFGSKVFEGPVNVVTSWRIDEISLTPIGADSKAKIRSSIIDNEDEIFGNGAEEIKNPPNRRNMDNENTLEETRTSPQIDVEKEVEKQVAQRAKEIENKFKEKEAVRKLCEKHGMDDVSETCGLNEARAQVLDFLAGKSEQSKVNISFGESEQEKKSDVISYAVCKRALVGYDKELQNELLGEEVKGWREFEGVSLLHLAEDDLNEAGVQTRYMAPTEIAQRALRMGNIRSESSGYWTPGTLPYLMMDASNKVLGAAYVQAPSTFQLLCKQLPSAKDFKNLNYLNVSETGLLDAWDAVSTPAQTTIGDSKEVLQVIPYAGNFSLPFSTIVNDDLGALTRVAESLGLSAKATLNARFWGIISDNAAMTDGYSIIDGTNHGNDGTAGAPDASGKFDELEQKMSEQTGSTGRKLAINARYVVGGPKTFAAIKRVCNSQYDFTQSNKFGASNIYLNELVPVKEPLITNYYWYMFADTSFETAVISYLQGQETPQLTFSIDPKNLSQNILVVQSAAVGVVNHRGIARNPYAGS